MRISDWSSDVCSSDLAWRQQPRAVKARVTGYVAGINHYLARTGAHALPAACRDAAWVRPITTADVMRLMRRCTLAGSSLQFVAAMESGSASCRERVCQYV